MRKRIYCLILAMLIALSAFIVRIPTVSAINESLGDANGDKEVTATDALLVLQHSVGKYSLSSSVAPLCDVNGDSNINATDALLILQFSVGKIVRFPCDDSPYTQKEYDEMISKLSYDTPASEITDAYRIHADGGMIYNPLSREAEKNGTLHKYDKAKMTTGTLTLKDGTSLNYSMPTDFTAYDMIPINYSFSSLKGSETVHFEATAAEEKERKTSEDLYDVILPNNVKLDFEFLGYTTATNNPENRAYNSLDFSSDVKGKQYPQYDTQDLVYSSTLPRADHTWFRFKFTNTGDTILDSDGNGTFCFEPVLERKTNSGEYKTYLIPPNIYYRITDALYPGESSTVDFIFTWDRDGGGGVSPFPGGEYRIKILSEVRNECSDDPANYYPVIWGGRTYCTSYFNFTVAREAADTPVGNVRTLYKKGSTKNKWLHTYEEFMTSYNSHLKPRLENVGETHTMYLQCAPWSKHVTLKLIRDLGGGIDTVDIPVNVETDSIKVNLNTTAQNYIIKDDGTRYPAMATQSMADMRVNTSLGPDADKTLLNELLDMKESGVNIVTTTAAFETDLSGRHTTNDTSDANWFMVDSVRRLGMKLEGFVSYPFSSATNVRKTQRITGDAVTFPNNYSPTSVADSLVAKACGVKTLYQFLRWGDNYYVTGKGTVPVTAEDSRGWMRIDISSREKLGSDGLEGFRIFARKKYGTIEKANAAWGKNYASFDDIYPEAGAEEDHGAIKYASDTAEFAEWSKAVNDLDVFRTEQRIENYNEVLSHVSDTFNAVMSIRTEGANWTSTVPYNTGNQHYRHVYYSQRRCAIIPEILAASGKVKIHSDYTTLPYTPSEITELTRSSVSYGITPMHLVQFDRLREIAINDTYGQDYSKEYNINGSATKGVFISTTRSLFQWYKATYEAGGIPGILWEDYLCDGFATKTQIKEMKFYSEKIAEAVNSAAGQKWANAEKTDAKKAVENSKGVYSFEPAYVDSLIEEVRAERKAAGK